MTRDEVFRRLVTLGVGLNITFVLWGVLQVCRVDKEPCCLGWWCGATRSAVCWCFLVV